MADFEKAIPIILKHEGGFVDHPSDPGGATNRGITFKLFKQYAKTLGLEKTIDSLKSLTEDQAKLIYELHFWQPMRGNEINDQNIADIVFDAHVNTGFWGLRLIQREVGAEVDGIIGSKTIEAINAANGKILFEGYKDARLQYYRNLVKKKPQLGVFLKGWENRVNSFEYKSGY